MICFSECIDNFANMDPTFVIIIRPLNKGARDSGFKPQNTSPKDWRFTGSWTLFIPKCPYEIYTFCLWNIFPHSALATMVWSCRFFGPKFCNCCKLQRIHCPLKSFLGVYTLFFPFTVYDNVVYPLQSSVALWSTNRLSAAISEMAWAE